MTEPSSDESDLLSGNCSSEWARHIAPKVLAAKDAQIAALREALEAIEPYQDAGGHWCVRCGASFWTMPDQTEAERVASIRSAALEMSGGVL